MKNNQKKHTDQGKGLGITVIFKKINKKTNRKNLFKKKNQKKIVIFCKIFHANIVPK